MAKYKPLRRNSNSPKTVNTRNLLNEKDLKAAMEHHLGSLMPKISNSVDKDGITNIIKQAMSSHLPEIIAVSLVNNKPIMEDNLNTLISKLPAGSGKYSVDTLQGMGTFMERLAFGLPVDTKPIADLNFNDLIQDLASDIRLSNNDFFEVYEDIENLVESEYMKAVANIHGMNNRGDRVYAGGEIKSKSGVSSGIDVGGFPMSNLLTSDGYEIIAEGIRKIYYKMSTLFLMSIRYDDVAPGNQRELVFRGAAIFHELIYDKIIEHIVGGGLTVIQTSKQPNKTETSYKITIDFRAANKTFRKIGNDVIEQVKATGLYAHQINMWDETQGSRERFFSDVVDLMKKRGLLKKGVKLKWEWQK